jgi:hypothetical protein
MDGHLRQRWGVDEEIVVGPLSAVRLTISWGESGRAAPRPLSVSPRRRRRRSAERRFGCGRSERARTTSRVTASPAALRRSGQWRTAVVSAA